MSHEESETRRRPGGRSSRVRAAVAEAAFALLNENGYDQWQLTDVAARAGVNKTTVYRRWPTKPDLVAELFIDLAAVEAATPDTGALVTDLEALLSEVVVLLRNPAVRVILGASITQSDGGSVEQARRAFWADRSRRSGTIVTRAIERGELPENTDADRLLHTVFGPVYLRMLVIGDEVDEQYLRGLAHVGTMTGESMPWVMPPESERGSDD